MVFSLSEWIRIRRPSRHSMRGEPLSFNKGACQTCTEASRRHAHGNERVSGERNEEETGMDRKVVSVRTTVVCAIHLSRTGETMKAMIAALMNAILFPLHIATRTPDSKTR
jgi:hypothetical protein